MKNPFSRQALQTRNVFVAVLALGLFAMAVRNVTDPDIWWHLRTGQLTLINHGVFHIDPYSFTRAGVPWVNHEWLFDVGMFWLYHAGGWAAPILTFAAIICAAFMLLFARCSARPFVAGIVTIWAALASLPTWGVRPQMASLFLASLVLLIRQQAQRNVQLWWWMLPLTLLWVNLHAEYALGIALLVLFLVGDLLDVLLGCESGRAVRPRLRTLGLVTLACVAIVPLNPYGVKIYGYPLATLRSAAMQRYIVEWFSPNFHRADYLPLMLFILASFAAATYSARRMRPSELLLLSVTMMGALGSIRHIPIYLLVAAPLLSEAVSVWLSNRSAAKKHSQPAKPATSALKLVLNAGLLLVCLSLVILHARSVIANQPREQASRFPEGVVAFLSSHPVAVPLFNSYDWGGYFIWELYPGYRVFIDGRADVYGDSFLDQYSNTYSLTDSWRNSLDHWNIQTVVVPPEAPLAVALEAQAGWKTAYADRQALVLTRTP